MKNKNWLRYSFASLIVAAGGAAAILVGCTSDDSDDVIVTQADAQTTDTGTETDGSTEGGTDSGPKPVPGKIVLVHAATDMGATNPTGLARVCYAIGAAPQDGGEATTSLAPLKPQPEVASGGLPYPGIPIGTGGPFGSTGLSLKDLVVVPYLMNSDAINALPAGRKELSCPELLANAVYLNSDAGAPVADGGAAPLVEGVDFWKLDAIPAQTILDENTYLLVTTGCPSNSTLGAKCGSDFTATGQPGRGNLKLTVYALDRSGTIAADQIGAQFVHASPQVAALLNPVFPGFLALPGADAGDAGPTFTAFAPDGGVSFPQAKATALISAKVDLAKDLVAPLPPSHPGYQPSQPGIPLPLVNQASAPTPDAGNDLALGKAFVFIALGDPSINAQDAGNQLNQLRSFHVLAFPVNPTVPAL